jgi:hypothetical protein
MLQNGWQGLLCRIIREQRLLRCASFIRFKTNACDSGATKSSKSNFAPRPGNGDLDIAG